MRRINGWGTEPVTWLNALPEVAKKTDEAGKSDVQSPGNQA
jgi:hypothetical protein